MLPCHHHCCDVVFVLFSVSSMVTMLLGVFFILFFIVLSVLKSNVAPLSAKQIPLGAIKVSFIHINFFWGT